MNLFHKLLHLILIKHCEVGTNFYSLIRDVKGGLESKSLIEVRGPGAFYYSTLILRSCHSCQFFISEQRQKVAAMTK